MLDYTPMAGFNNFLRLNSMLLFLLSICVLFTIEGSSQVKFIQITDPHLYDDSPQNIRDNNRAFVAAIHEINRQMEQGRNYDFVVVTGDLGLEKLFDEIKKEKNDKSPRKFNEANSKENLGKKARQLAEIIDLSDVNRWIFVPGNNDLFDEKPENTVYFTDFIEEIRKKLEGKKEIIDLTNPERQRVYSRPDMTFVGFNDASFKNQYDPSRLFCSQKDVQALPIHTAQLKELEDVLNALNSASNKPLFIFYHIPELDDRYLYILEDESIATGQKRGLTKKNGVPSIVDEESVKKNNFETKNDPSVRFCTGEENLYSPWFVSKDIRNQWNEIIKDERIKGLFAGHFHDYRRETYTQTWIKSKTFPYDSVSKLYVCPPLAMKVQNEKPEIARGFQEVSIDKEGNVLDDNGKNGVHIFWYDKDTQTFTSDYDDAKEREALSQLKLGELYENNKRLADAEAAYSKALASDNSIIRQSAGEGLDRVVEKQASPWSKYVFSGQTVSQETLIFLASLTIFILIGTWLWYDTNNYRRQKKVLPSYWVVIWMVGGLFLAWVFLLIAGNYLSRISGTVFPPGWAVFIALILIAFSFWFVYGILLLRGRDKLFISPVIDTTEHKLGTTFAQIFSMISDDLAFVRGFQMISLPHIVIGEAVDFVNLIEESVGGIYGKVFGWFLRRSSRPEYALKSTLQPSGSNLTITIRLEKRGEVAGTWNETFDAAELFDRQEQLALDVLTFLERVMD